MIKSYLHLLGVILLPLSYLLFSTSYNPINAINQWFIYDRVVDSYRGSFYLIENQLQNIPKSDWEKKFDMISSKFAYPIKIIHINSTLLNDIKLTKTDKGNYVFYLNKNNKKTIVKRLSNSDWVIYLMLEESEDQEILNESKGTLQLLTNHMNNFKPEQWQSALQEIEPQFGFQLKLSNFDELSLPKNKQKQLLDIGKTWVRDENKKTHIYLQMPDSQVVIDAGPIPLPGPEFSLIVALVALIVGVISIGILFYVLPLWWDLNKLSQTASVFGEGYLDKRAVIGKRSSISSLANSFNLMAERIEKMVKGQKNLTNAIAHDLRTPLSKLSFAFEMLKSGKISAEEKLRYEDSISMGIDTLDHLIQQILTLSRYSRAADITHFSPCKLASLLKDEIDQHQEKHVELTFELDISPELLDKELFVDKRAILRAINNLLVNAVQYSNKKLRIAFFMRENSYVLLVEDDGPGIPQSDRESVFLPFKQLGNKQREFSKGHGLGLAIVKQIMEWHKGSVFLDRSDLGGARFKISWPIA